MTTKLATACALVLIAVVLCTPVEAQDDSDLAQDLTNPVADLLTIPIQMNYDQNIGLAEDGWKLQTTGPDAALSGKLEIGQPIAFRPANRTVEDGEELEMLGIKLQFLSKFTFDDCNLTVRVSSRGTGDE
jgi:hypothetical protein